MKIPTDNQIDSFFENHPYLTFFGLILFVGGFLKFLKFVCVAFYGV